MLRCLGHLVSRNGKKILEGQMRYFGKDVDSYCDLTSLRFALRQPSYASSDKQPRQAIEIWKKTNRKSIGVHIRLATTHLIVKSVTEVVN